MIAKRSLAATVLPMAAALLFTLFLINRGERVLAQTQEPAPAPTPAPEATPASAPDNPPEAATDKQDLSKRYRLLERYSPTDEPARPELLTQYQVGLRETIKRTRERPQAAPDQDHILTQCIYTERVAKVAKGGLVTEVVRHYDKVNHKTSLDIPRYKTKLLEGLTLLVRLQPRSLMQVVCLPPVRQLRQLEYMGVTQEPFVPNVAGLLPLRAGRVGDTWPVPREVAAALLGETPSDEEYDLTAEILEIHKTGSGPSMIAAIGVKGQVVVEQGPCGINAQIQFMFVPSETVTPSRAGADGATTTARAASSGKPGGRVDNAIEAKGYIRKISLAQEISIPMPGNDARLKQNIRRELVLERHVAQAGEVVNLLEIPTPAPEVEVANSWLLYDDPQGRFHMLHPQELHVANTYPSGGVDLLDRRPDGQDVIQMYLNPKTGDPERDRLAAAPEQAKKQLEDQWKQRGEKVVAVPSGWLPEAEWKPRRVYRIEAALIPAAERAPTPAARIYLDHYIVQFSRPETMIVSAMTTRDQHGEFRDSVEKIIKSFDFGPSEGSLPAAPTRARRLLAHGEAGRH